MIDAKNISIGYGGEQIINNFDLHVGRGERIALMGPSGCGKTSLMHAVAGLVKPTGGNIKVSGRVSCVFQEPRLLPWLSALENINVVLSDSPETLPEARRWLDAAGLSEAADKLPAELSGGMQQRIAICRALAYEGDILLLDEPLKGMDRELKEKISRLILRCAEGKTLMLVTHDEEEAEVLAQKTYHFIDGSFVER